MNECVGFCLSLPEMLGGQLGCRSLQLYDSCTLCSSGRGTMAKILMWGKSSGQRLLSAQGIWVLASLPMSLRTQRLLTPLGTHVHRPDQCRLVAISAVSYSTQYKGLGTGGGGSTAVDEWYAL